MHLTWCGGKGFESRVKAPKKGGEAEIFPSRPYEWHVVVCGGYDQRGLCVQLRRWQRGWNLALVLLRYSGPRLACRCPELRQPSRNLLRMGLDWLLLITKVRKGCHSVG